MKDYFREEDRRYRELFAEPKPPAERTPRKVLLAVLFLGILAALAIGASGCAEKLGDGSIVFEEKAGGNVAYILTEINGKGPVDAITIQDLRGRPVTIYLRNSEDLCLKIHEDTHTKQILAQESVRSMDRFAPPWLWLYIANHIMLGYVDNPFEVEARAAQHMCEAKRNEEAIGSGLYSEGDRRSGRRAREDVGSKRGIDPRHPARSRAYVGRRRRRYAFAAFAG